MGRVGTGLGRQLSNCLNDVSVNVNARSDKIEYNDDQDKVSVKNDDDEDDQRCLQHDEYGSTATPSVNNGDVESYEGMNSEGSSHNNGKCDISIDRKCITHNCGTRAIKVSTKKWALNKKTGLFGNKYVKVTKLICISKNGGSDSPRISTSTQTGSRAAVNNLVGRADIQVRDLDLRNTENIEK